LTLEMYGNKLAMYCPICNEAFSGIAGLIQHWISNEVIDDIKEHWINGKFELAFYLSKDSKFAKFSLVVQDNLKVVFLKEILSKERHAREVSRW